MSEQKIKKEPVSASKKSVNNPSFEEITNEIETLKAEINMLEQEELAVAKAKSRQDSATLSKAGIKKPKEIKRKHFSKKDFARNGTRIHCVPIPKKAFKYMSADDKRLFGETTRPFAISAFIQALLIIGIFAAVAGYAFSNMKTGTEIIYVVLAYFVAALLIIKPSNILEGYTNVWTGANIYSFWDWLFYMLSIIVWYASFLFTFLIKMLFIVLKMERKLAQASMPRVGMPEGIGYNHIIQQGLEIDELARLSNQFDEMLYNQAKQDADRWLSETQDYINELENAKVGESVEVQEAAQRQIEEAQDQMATLQQRLEWLED